MDYSYDYLPMAKQHVHRNRTVDWLSRTSLRKGEVIRAGRGPLVVYTGKYTGRSPKDKYIVDTRLFHDKIDWGPVNQPVSEAAFERLFAKTSSYLAKRSELFIFDGFVGADDRYKMEVRIISEYAYQALFCTHLFRRPTSEELKKHVPKITVYSAPDCFADPPRDGTKTETFVVLHPEKQIVLIGGTKYSGEIKKSVFSMMNILLPQKRVLPMHCSANISASGETALFFGLSGTGKTTLSADPLRRLIGDDEHGWSDRGIFNMEGGCYAKCINLKKENEPQIWNAIRKKTLLENVVLKKDGAIDFTDKSLTENTRAVYPIDFIENAVLAGVGGHPSYILFLTADAMGVLPPVARLTTAGAMYHFMSGYTSKLAGTERGVVEPKATFSPFFGGPFMALKPIIYANLLKRYLLKYKSRVYLVNTGWTKGPYGVGERISIKDTRSIVSAILSGSLDKTAYRTEVIFNLKVPRHMKHVAKEVLEPRLSWKDVSAYNAQAKKLAGLFISNFSNFADIPYSVQNAGPIL